MFSRFEIGNIDAGPFFGLPPDQFFAFAPGSAIRLGAGTIVNDAAIACPIQTPAVSESIFRLRCFCLVHTVKAEKFIVNPSSARGRLDRYKFVKSNNMRTNVE